MKIWMTGDFFSDTRRLISSRLFGAKQQEMQFSYTAQQPFLRHDTHEYNLVLLKWAKVAQQPLMSTDFRGQTYPRSSAIKCFPWRELRHLMPPEETPPNKSDVEAPERSPTCPRPFEPADKCLALAASSSDSFKLCCRFRNANSSWLDGWDADEPWEKEIMLGGRGMFWSEVSKTVLALFSLPYKIWAKVRPSRLLALAYRISLRKMALAYL